MAGKSYRGTAPIDRYEEARNLADMFMMTNGYSPCLDKFQPRPWSALDAGAVVRLYTMDKARGTNRGGVSVGMSKTELMSPHWSQYVAHQIEIALQRKVT